MHRAALFQFFNYLSVSAFLSLMHHCLIWSNLYSTHFASVIIRSGSFIPLGIPSAERFCFIHSVGHSKCARRVVREAWDMGDANQQKQKPEKWHKPGLTANRRNGTSLDLTQTAQSRILPRSDRIRFYIISLGAF